MLVGAQKPLSQKVAPSPIRQAWGNARSSLPQLGLVARPASLRDGPLMVLGSASAALALERPPRLQSCSAMAMSCACAADGATHTRHSAASPQPGQQRRHAAHEALMSRSLIAPKPARAHPPPVWKLDEPGAAAALAAAAGAAADRGGSSLEEWSARAAARLASRPWQAKISLGQPGHLQCSFEVPVPSLDVTDVWRRPGLQEPCS